MKSKVYIIDDALEDCDVIDEFLQQAKAPQYIKERMDHVRGMMLRLGALARHIHAAADERKTAETQARMAVDGK